MSKIIRIIMIVFFISALIIPIVCINDDHKKINWFENRFVVSFPNIRQENYWNIKFLNDFEAWWTDNIGFRESALRAHTELIYFLFGEIQIPNYLEGRAQHLFLKREELIKNFQGKRSTSISDQKRALSYLQEAQKYFAGMNAQLLVVIIPDKERIYPEFYPKGILTNNKLPMLEVFTSFANEYSNLNIISLTQSLLQQKSNDDLLYSKLIDPAHWNWRGAFYGYQAIMNSLKRYFREINILQESDFEITKDAINAFRNPYRLDIFRFDTMYCIYDFDYIYTLKTRNDNIKRTIINDKNHEYLFTNTTNSNLPRLLIISDSYIHMFFMSWFIHSFSEVYNVDRVSADKIKKITEEFQPDFVLIEMVERAASKTLTDTFSFLGGI